MRLIDADALIEFCAERWIPLNIDAVNMQPTIQPEKAQLSREGTTKDTNVGDTISRQAAIDLFSNDVLEWDTFNGYIAPHVARRLIEQLPPAQTEPQWIPVSERVPENGKYIVTVHGYGWNGTMFTSVSIAECISKRWVGNNGVIAWMPLPAPYQKGAKD